MLPLCTLDFADDACGARTTGSIVYTMHSHRFGIASLSGFRTRIDASWSRCYCDIPGAYSSAWALYSGNINASTGTRDRTGIVNQRNTGNPCLARKDLSGHMYQDCRYIC